MYVYMYVCVYVSVYFKPYHFVDRVLNTRIHLHRQHAIEAQMLILSIGFRIHIYVDTYLNEAQILTLNYEF